ncbi:hypothetical protein [Breoghania sp.]|uniref:hypothetical protein n=1 Tax=Breoghania sp. TaxID=2065378 RepID=UPI0026329A77|nr:hypothetical protein [Breoghania sp.]MDJ0932622.1 hypothetical protein [Breoghania sp.]
MGSSPISARLDPALEAKIGIDTIDPARLGLGDDPALGAVEAVNIDFSLDGFSRPATATGGLTWNGERFDIAAKAAPEPSMAGKKLPPSRPP